MELYRINNKKKILTRYLFNIFINYFENRLIFDNSLKAENIASNVRNVLMDVFRIF